MKQHQNHDNRAVPNGWHKIRLGDVVEVNRRHWSPVDGAQILYLDLTSVVRPGRLATPKEIAAADAPGRARRRVGSGDVLVSTVRPNLRGCARVQRAADNLIASTGFAVLSPQNEVDGSFIDHHVMTGQFAGYLENVGNGLKMRTPPVQCLTDIKGFPLLLPPLCEQRSIGAILDSIDEAIEQTEAVIDTSEALRSAMLHELLARGVPGWHSEWKNVPGFGTVPAEWNLVRLGEVAEISFSSVDKKTLEGESPIRLCNYTDVFYHRRISTDMRFMTATANAKERDRWKLKRGDVLFTKDSETPDELGIPSAVVEDIPDVLCGYHLGVARPSSNALDGSYLAEALRSAASKRQFARVANGVTRFGLTLEATRAIRVLLPTPPEQRAIAELLASVDEQAERARDEHRELDTMKKLLADALLPGRVRIFFSTSAQLGRSELI